MGLKFKTVRIYAFVLFTSVFFYNCNVVNAIELIKSNNDLIVVYNGDTISLNNVLAPEINAYYERSSESSFFIVYEYYASRDKMQIKYSLELKGGRIFVNKVVYFFYDDIEGIPYGWICLTNKEFDSLKTSLDELIDFNVEVQMNMYSQKNRSYQVGLSPYGSSHIYYFNALKNENNIEINMPFFYDDGSYIGHGKFHYEADEWHNLSMNFPIVFFESDYFLFDQELSIKNVRHYNDIAFFLEQGHNFIEAIIILEKIRDNFPSRTVSYINLGDAYWGLEEFENAKQAYSTYIKQMKASGRESRIPSRVIERVD